MDHNFWNIKYFSLNNTVYERTWRDLLIEPIKSNTFYTRLNNIFSVVASQIHQVTPTTTFFNLYWCLCFFIHRHICSLVTVVPCDIIVVDVTAGANKLFLIIIISCFYYHYYLGNVKRGAMEQIFDIFFWDDVTGGAARNYNLLYYKRYRKEQFPSIIQFNNQ